MSKQQIFAAAIIVSLVTLLSLNPPSASVVGFVAIGAFFLFGWLAYLERQKIDRTKEFDQRLGKLKEQFDVFKIERGLRR